MKKKHPERIRKDKTLLHIYDNNDLNSHSENVKEIERAQKLNKDEDDDVVKGVGEKMQGAVRKTKRQQNLERL